MYLLIRTWSKDLRTNHIGFAFMKLQLLIEWVENKHPSLNFEQFRSRVGIRDQNSQQTQ